jgi:hypothetical protein
MGVIWRLGSVLVVADVVVRTDLPTEVLLKKFVPFPKRAFCGAKLLLRSVTFPNTPTQQSIEGARLPRS